MFLKVYMKSPFSHFPVSIKRLQGGLKIAKQLQIRGFSEEWANVGMAILRVPKGHGLDLLPLYLILTIF